jgi:hypothetical protein
MTIEIHVMTTEKRKNRYSLYLSDSENALIRSDAIEEKGYSNKAIGRYLRDELLSSLSKADKTPSIIIPAVSSSTSKDLKGAVNNLNQSVRVLNTIALSSSLSAQKAEAEKMMVDVLELADICKQYKDFLDGDISNKKILAHLAIQNLGSKALSNLSEKKGRWEKKQ